MPDGRHVGKYWKCHKMHANKRFGQNLGNRISSRPRHVRLEAVAMATAVA